MTDPARWDRSATLSEADLETWGRQVGRSAAEGSLGLPLVVALRGPLGAGKSVLARAIARGAGVEGPMPSPTYNLLFRYQGSGGLEVYHLDLYRLEDPDDVWELGWQELAEGDQVVLIEWPERAEPLVPADRWDVRLSFVARAGAGGAGADDAAAGTVPERGVRQVRIEPRGDAPAPIPLPGPSQVGGRTS